MLDKYRKILIPRGTRPDSKNRVRNIVAYVIFGAIIVVFALFGIDPNQYGGGGTGGVAAVVNHEVIPLAEYRSRVDELQQSARMDFSQFPEAQRRMFMNQLSRRAL